MDYFYFGTIRKLTGTFGSIFSNITIKQNDKTGNPAQDYKVPIKYGPKSIWLERKQQHDRDIDSNQARTQRKLPAMSYELGRFAFANDRNIQTHTKTRTQNVSETDVRYFTQSQDIPYDFTFTLTIQTKHIDDGLQIIEQILPKFSPNYVVNIKEIPELDVYKDVSIDLIGVNTTDDYDGPIENNKRILTWELEFIAHAYIFPPVKRIELIKRVNNHFNVDDNVDNSIGDIETTVNPNDAEIFDDWDANVVYDFPNE